MTNEQHPIVPTAELVEEWFANSPMDRGRTLATLAAQWGAEQELKACLLLVGDGRRENLSQAIALRTARRPKPPSLKEQALALLDELYSRALGALDD